MTLDLDSTPVFDASLREELDLVGGPELHPRLVAMFVEDCTAMCVELDAALQANDSPAAARVAHRVKGGAAAIGARRVVAVARAMEPSAKDGDIGPSRELRAVLDTEVGALTGA